MKLMSFCLILSLAVLTSGCEMPQTSGGQSDMLITTVNFDTIVGRQWVLESMTVGGQPYAMTGKPPLIQFGNDSKVSGFASLNRFIGGVQIDDSGQLTWPGPFAMTRMAGPEALMKQEDVFVKTLPKTEQMSLKADRLYIYTKDRTAELVFAAAKNDSQQ